MVKYKNPELEIGQKILLLKSNNGSAPHEGNICDVESVSKDRRTAGVRSSKTNALFTIYQTGPGDEWIIVDRKKQAKYLREKAEELIKEADKLNKEADALDKYESDEQEAAHKISLLLRNPSPKNIEKVLKQMKKSNYL